jgi:hypothetical protein
MIRSVKFPVPRWHAQFLSMLPRIRDHAAVAFRHLRPEARAEAVQEVVCNALKAFVRLVELKKTGIAYPTVLARYGVAQVRDGRKVGSSLNIRDVSSEYAQRQKGFSVERLDQYDRNEEAWMEVFIEDKHSGPAVVATTKIDFTEWLKSLPSRVRRIAKLLATGEKTSIVAEKFSLSPGRISQLRKELAQAWKKFQGEEPDSTTARASHGHRFCPAA